jgi:hypothetical protein
MESSTDNLFFYFKVDPFHETVDMHSSARARTLARVKEVILSDLSLFEAYFTLIGFGFVIECGIEMHNFSGDIALCGCSL